MALTTLSGAVPDQRALYSLLIRIRDLSLPLISANYVEATLAQAPGQSNGDV